MTCPKESQHAEFAHAELGEGAWVHLRKTITHEQKQRIEIAELAADYKTQGTARAAYEMVRTHLSGAPAEWRNGYTDTDGTVHEPQFEPTLQGVKFWLDQYETKIETVLLGPETRQKMAKATVDFYAACAEVFCAEGSWGAWPPADGALSELVEAKSIEAWYAWRVGVNARLKAAGVASSEESTTP